MKRISLAVLAVLCLLWGGTSYAQSSEPNYERLADAIYKAEGGAGTNYPYGILEKYKHTTPRQACINTIKHKYRDWVAQGSKGDFLEYLQSKYAPIGVSNDPENLNSHWLSNVRRLYEA